MRVRRRWLLLVAFAACDDKDPTQPTLSGGTFTSSGPASEAGSTDPPAPTSSSAGTSEASTSTASVTSSTTADDTASTGPESTTAGLGHAVDIAPIWATYCVAGCHTPGGTGDALVGMILEADVAYSMLVGVKSVQLPTMERVVPGDPTVSYLWHKLGGTHQQVGGSGLQMPQGGMLPPAEFELVAQWIAEGAAP